MSDIIKFLNFLFAEMLLLLCLKLWFYVGPLLLDAMNIVEGVYEISYISKIASVIWLLWAASLIFGFMCVLEEWIDS